MKTHSRTKFLIALLLLAVFLAASFSIVHALANFDLSWWSVDGGGAMNLAAGGYNLSGSAGQPDAASLANGGYTLNGGFWAGFPANFYNYLPPIRH
jgi:hypothetical protein